MNFQALKYHLETYGCSLDHMEDNLYFVTNCINAFCCEIEELPQYLDVTICHYCYELGVPIPEQYKIESERYRHFRENIIKISVEDHKEE